MASDEFKVKCIKPSATEVSVRYTETFNALKLHGFKPQWIDEESCFELKQKEKKTIYLFDQFEGAAFDHLKSLGSRILGCICVLTCLELQVEIPRTKVPIHNLAMKDVIISCTNIDKELRESIHVKVLMMGGEISRNLTEHVTHLVAGSVGSSKYQVASNCKKPIMLPEWVDRVWEAAQEGSVYCSDEKFQKYRCPVFKGLTITVSGLDMAERKEVNKLIKMEGGKYSGEMNVDECTHLVINEPKGQKYEFARKWKIHIIRPQWLYDSIEARTCLEENKYSLTSDISNLSSGQQVLTSTPTKNTSTVDMSLTNISAITHLSDTVCNSVMSSNQTMANSIEKDKRSSLEQIDILKVSPEPFLDGYKIYVSGFNGASLEKLRKIINIGGGTRFNILNEEVTHVIIGEMVKADIEYLQKATHRPHIVTSEWLINCVKQGKSVPESPYYVQNITFENLPTPKPQSEKSSLKKDRSLTLEKDASRTIQSEFTDNLDEEMALMSQYLPEANTQMTDDAFKSMIPSNLNLESFESTLQQQNQTMNSESSQINALFSKKKFICCNLGEMKSAVETVIVENGGKLLKNSRLIPDFAVVPLGGCDVKLTAHEIVTHVWLESCLEQNCLLPTDSNTLFQPIEINLSAKPLKNCVISFSGFSGVEKNCLMYLGDILGATSQLCFVRRASKDMLGNTHLVIKEASGSKYEAALKWKIPTVKTDWLLACAKSGKLEPELKFNLTSAKSSSNASMNDTTVTNERTDLTANPNSVFVTPLQLPPDTSRVASSKTKPVEMQTDLDTSHNTSGRSDNTIPVTNATSDNHDTTITSKLSGSQKENINAAAMTTAAVDQEQIGTVPLQHSRVKELQREKSTKLSPRQNNIQPIVDNETPSKFLGSGKEYRPAFELDSFTNDLESRVDDLSNRSRRSSIQWSELFSKHIEEGVRISAIPKTDEIINSQKIDPINDINTDPLKDVVISVARKLSAHQSTYNDIAVSLGAGYTWTYDKKCTHFIFQGKLNDINREFRLAREQGKFVVSPYWLTMCKEQNARVDETLFPHTFNPNLSLQSIVNEPKETPRRSKRSTRSFESPAVPRTPHEPKLVPIEIEANNEEKMETNVPQDDHQGATNGLDDPQIETENVIQMAEIQEALNKELENIKASGSKRSKKRTKKSVNNSTSDSNHATPTSLSARKTSSAKSKDKNRGSGSESSQSVQVMWDDPTERMEMQKVAAQLEKACCSTQDALDIHTPMKRDCDFQQPMETDESNGKKHSSRTSTPEQPSIASPPQQDGRPATKKASSTSQGKSVFPLSKKLETMEAPQPVELLSDDEPFESISAAVDIGRPLCFLLSGILPNERVDYGALIEELGGTVMEGQNYHETCTHLIAGTPTRNEKFLACVASGKWVLHKSYFEDCRKAKRFVREDKHEWGSESTKSVLVGESSQTKSLAAAAQRWRLKILELKKQNPNCRGAFDNWSVLLCTDKKKESNFERLLKAGGAKVLSVRPPFNSSIEATHAFLELNKIPLTTEDLEVLLRNNILCLRPDYIAAFLTSDALPEEFCPPEVVALRARLNLSDTNVRKRKSTLVGLDAKRNRNL